ncbi:hypothetical protein PQ455_10530 [Sphingomonas naphthae]|uniref:DUF1127 domain-containing protein n=1 Tax=Sphingomonas naphthae TaxID=1813468 RepID=A0ABY7TJM8_9SPHN|nr:hypothetical protein [Sphingomonas naphthae]WCT72084.1 hypothetical protein PQ455_10530 [Sphingomonas naphthae]
MSAADAWIAQGFLMAIADMIRRHDAVEIGREMLADRAFSRETVLAAGLQPYDVRELLKALPRPVPRLEIVARG